MEIQNEVYIYFKLYYKNYRMSKSEQRLFTTCQYFLGYVRFYTTSKIWFNSKVLWQKRRVPNHPTKNIFWLRYRAPLQRLVEGLDGSSAGAAFESMLRQFVERQDVPRSVDWACSVSELLRFVPACQASFLRCWKSDRGGLPRRWLPCLVAAPNEKGAVKSLEIRRWKRTGSVERSEAGGRTCVSVSGRRAKEKIFSSFGGTRSSMALRRFPNLPWLLCARD